MSHHNTDHYGYNADNYGYRPNTDHSGYNTDHYGYNNLAILQGSLAQSCTEN